MGLCLRLGLEFCSGIGLGAVYGLGFQRGRPAAQLPARDGLGAEHPQRYIKKNELTGPGFLYQAKS